MNINITLSHKAIFGIEPPEINKLLEGISSETVLCYLAILNSMEHSNYSFEEMFAFLSRNWSRQKTYELSFSIFKYLNISSSSTKNIKILSRKIICSWIDYELNNFRSIKTNDTTPEEEFRLFQVYIIFHEKIGIKLDGLMENPPADQKLWFQSHTWPLLLSQYGYNYRCYNSFELHRSMCLLDTISKDSKLSGALDEFLDNKDKSSYIAFNYDLFQIIQLANTKKPNSRIPRISFTLDNISDDFLRNMSLECSKIGNLKNLSVLKSPLLKRDDGSYVVLDWSFLSNQTYLGLLFDLFYNSKINESFNSFAEFKNYVGKTIIEQRVFVPIIKLIFDHKHTVKIFDTEDSQGIPDAYVRENNSLFIFEFKDALLNFKSYANSSFEDFKNEIDKKLIRNEKEEDRGIGQLIKCIDHLNENLYSLDDFTVKKKRRNIVVYPILVITDFMLTLDGVNDYLANYFNSNIKANNFKRVESPVIITLDFLYRNIAYIKSEGLDKLLLRYNKKIKNQKKSFGKITAYEYFKCFGDFTRHMEPKDKSWYSKNSENTKELLRGLELKYDTV